MGYIPGVINRGILLYGPASLPDSVTEMLTVTTGGVIGHATIPAAGVSDHGDLDGLTDDDHTQYLLLAGRTGGQTLNGDTASGGNLTLSATAHATKGKINFGSSGLTFFEETTHDLTLGALDSFIKWGNSTHSPRIVTGPELLGELGLPVIRLPLTFSVTPHCISPEAKTNWSTPSLLITPDELLVINLISRPEIRVYLVVGLATDKKSTLPLVILTKSKGV